MTATAISEPPAISSPMLSVAEACEYLRVRKSFLYVLIGRGDLQARKLGGRTLVLKSDADALIESLPLTPIHDAGIRTEARVGPCRALVSARKNNRRRTSSARVG